MRYLQGLVCMFTYITLIFFFLTQLSQAPSSRVDKSQYLRHPTPTNLVSELPNQILRRSRLLTFVPTLVWRCLSQKKNKELYKPW